MAVSLTYLAGVSSISGALVAGALTQAGIFTALTSDLTGSSADDYVFAISGVLLIVTAITAPEGLTGLWRDRVVGRFVHSGRPVPALESDMAAARSARGAAS